MDGRGCRRKAHLGSRRCSRCGDGRRCRNARRCGGGRRDDYFSFFAIEEVE